MTTKTKNSNWKWVGLVALLLVGGVVTWNRVSAPKNPQVLGEQTSLSEAAPSPSPVVLGESESDEQGESVVSRVASLVSNLIACNGPDGKTSQASKSDCDNLWKFWNAHPAAGWGGGSSGGSSDSGSSSSGSSTPTPTPTPTPAPVVIDEVNSYYCESSSCTDITTVEVIGSGYDADARVEAIGQDDEVTYAGTLVGGNMSTTILTDFDSLPCQVYDVRVYFTSDAREAYGVAAFTPVSCL